MLVDRITGNAVICIFIFAYHRKLAVPFLWRWVKTLFNWHWPYIDLWILGSSIFVLFYALTTSFLKGLKCDVVKRCVRSNRLGSCNISFVAFSHRPWKLDELNITFALDDKQIYTRSKERPLTDTHAYIWSTFTHVTEYEEVTLGNALNFPLLELAEARGIFRCKRVVVD